jgi:hypothetical protein
MKKRSSKLISSKTVATTVAKPVSVEFKMKSGETVFFRALRTTRVNRSSRFRAKTR